MEQISLFVMMWEDAENVKWTTSTSKRKRKRRTKTMIQITEKLRIVKVDERNLAIEQLRTVTSEKRGSHDEWCWCGYYGTIKSALLDCLNKQLFDIVSEELQLKDIIARIETAESNIKNMNIVEGKI